MMATGRTTTWSCLRRSNTVVLWWLTVVVAAVGTVSASVKEYYWEMEYMFAKPDCKESIVMAINGTFPGPTITATVGDTVIVHVVNKLHTEGVVIHWHGIRQIGTPWADGAAGVTQCAINPGESFSYKFIVDKAGTYFYHGHFGMQRSAGLYGWLIIDAEKEPFQYDGELYMLLSDWWHESTHFQQVRLSSKPFHWIGEPQSILINGKGQFNCSLAAQFSDGLKNECSFGFDDGQCNPPETLVVKPNKKYRLRIASTTSLSSLNVAIQGHKLEVVEADGNYITPFLTDDIDIYSGETYSVILRTDQHPGENYWISVGVRGRKPETPPALAFLRYFIAPHNGFPKSPPPETPQWNDFNRSKAFTKGIFARDGSPPPPEKSLHRLYLLNTQNLINGFTKWAINNVSLVVPTTPYLGSIKYGLREAYDHREPPRNFPADYDINKPTANQSSVHGNGIYVFEYNVTVDVILQNAEALKAGKSEIHPWHLHGHDFWVLGYGEGKFRPGVDETAFNLKNPPLRNTAVLYPYGWTALRYVTDNPGVWFFHCHIEPHLHMGMGVVFAEGINRLGDIPDDALGCGMTRTIFVNRHR